MSSSASVFRLIRVRLLTLCIYAGFFAILSRLYYWQVHQSDHLQAQAQDQYQRTQTTMGQRGQILLGDGTILAENKAMFRVVAQPHLIEDASKAIEPVFTLLKPNTIDPVELQPWEALKAAAYQRVGNKSSRWSVIYPEITADQKQAIASLELTGITFESFQKRHYPEASFSAHAIGFVGKNERGEDIGYYGIEGELQDFLTTPPKTTTVLKDALGQRLWSDQQLPGDPLLGQSVTLTIRHDIQKLLEEKIALGASRYGAVAGEVIVMDPSTGQILGMASTPTYNPEKYREFPTEVYKNHSVATSFEPGSIFKLLTMAAGLDAGVVNPTTQCPKCDGPRQIDKYTIKTWNNEYHPQITMTDALAKSDNVAMIYVAELLGQERFLQYIEKFGIGEQTGIELQEEMRTKLRARWGFIDLATASFGQGLSVTSIQMIRAVGAIANQGVLLEPTLVERIGRDAPPAKPTRQVVSPEAARTLTTMMVEATQKSEAQWTNSRTHRVAGKTGTAQVAVNGKYHETQTNASYIGFAPPEKPKFVMLVKLESPSSSPWAAETSAPLWFEIANQLYLLLNIPPDVPLATPSVSPTPIPVASPSPVPAETRIMDE
jgi:cell division protein FtsI/penicillin-binding protein 2